MPQHRLVRDVMPAREPVTLPPHATVQEAVERMVEAMCGSVLVCADGRLLGIFTERDLVTRVVAQRLDPTTTELSSVMTRDPDTIASTETAREAIRRMDEFVYHHLPVMENGRLLGVVSMRDMPLVTLARMAPELDQRHALAERMW